MEDDILVIGAGPAGLAVCGALAAHGRRALVVEKAADVGSAWRRHYERLHLHTVKSHSALPGLRFPAEYPRYVPRRQVVDYLEAYARRFAIAPRFGVEAMRIERDGDGWRTTVRGASTVETIRSRFVVVATGANAVPARPALPGEERFAGPIVHSRDYRDARPFAGRRVLVVGVGNTGAEIALDLAEQGARASLSARSPVNVVRRDVLGRPTQLTALALSKLPLPIGDAVGTLLARLTVGRLARHGLRWATTSPLADLRERGRTPMIDIGTVARIRAGEIAVFPGIERIDGATAVRFVDGRAADFDAIVLATGYRAAAAELFAPTPVDVDDHGLPRATVGDVALDGAFFVGFDVRQAGGLLRTIALQADEVAAEVERRSRRGAPVPDEVVRTRT